MKFLTSIWIVLITITVGVGLRVFDVDPLKILRLKTFDYYQKIQPRDVTSNHFIIVEVTEQDLKRFGQWPWSRSLIAEIHSKLIVQNVNTIQYNILFSEPDRLNPKSFTDNYKIDAEIKNELMKLPSNDQYLSQFFSVEGSKAVLMYSIKYSPTDGRVKKPNMMFKGSDPTPWLYNFLGIVTNLPQFLDSAKGVGANIMIPSIDGTVRSQPLLINTDQGIIPAQVLETLRVAMNGRAYKIITGQDGIKEIYLTREIVIRPDANAMININYADPNMIKTISVSELLDGTMDFTNKIVIVGLNAAGLSTLKDTPLGLMTDMQISAQAMDTMATHSSLYRDSNTNLLEIIGTTILLIAFLILVPRLNVFWTAGLLFSVLGGIAYGGWYMYSTRYWLVDVSWPILILVLTWTHLTFNNFAIQSRLRQQIKKQFEHYLAPDMVAKLQKDPGLLKLGGEKRNMTFLFSDIRGFTPISEKYKGNPEGLTRLINRFLTRMTDVIIANGGTIDKFMGDCIMAFWNAPITNKNHATLAVKSAIEMQKELKILNKELKKEKLPAINIGIGINTGEALVGNMGSEQRFDYSVIGDDVNLASRLESSSKELGNTLVVGHNTKTQTKGFKYKSLGQIKVKGKSQKIKVYTI
jgi:adenylate cyclase